MDLLLPAKKLKHRLWLLRLHYSPDYFRRLRARRKPFRFDATRYRVPGMDIVMPSVSTFQVNHLEFSAPEGTASPSPTSCPNQIFLFWTGPNELTPNRTQAVAQLRALNPSTDLHLVTAQNLPDYLIRGVPLHAGYPHLSYVHRSDYLRSYFMHHHGGAYVDIKRMRHPWLHPIARLNESPTAWVIGPEEKGSANTSPAFGPGPLGRDQETYFAHLVSQASFAMRPRTALTSEWFHEVQRRMDYFAGLLLEHPSDDPFGLAPGYPVPWRALHGSILTPLFLKYHDRLLIDERAHFLWSNYR